MAKCHPGSVGRLFPSWLAEVSSRRQCGHTAGPPAWARELGLACSGQRCPSSHRPLVHREGRYRTLRPHGRRPPSSSFWTDSCGGRMQITLSGPSEEIPGLCGLLPPGQAVAQGSSLSPPRTQLHRTPGSALPGPLGPKAWKPRTGPRNTSPQQQCCHPNPSALRYVGWSCAAGCGRCSGDGPEHLGEVLPHGGDLRTVSLGTCLQACACCGLVETPGVHRYRMLPPVPAGPCPRPPHTSLHMLAGWGLQPVATWPALGL